MDRRFGLKVNCIIDIVNVLKLQSEVEEAIIFGSRAMGTYQNGSDIDIALKGEKITFDTISTLRLRLDELPYLYMYDVIDYKKVSNPAVTAHIDELGIVIYEKEEQPSEWLTYRLGELIQINASSISKNYPYKQIEYLDTSSVTENRFSELQRLELIDAPSRAKRVVKENDIVYSTVRPILRHYGIAKNIKPNTVASTGFAVLTAKGIDPYFLYYYLTTDEIVQFLNNVAEANTTTFPAFNASLFENIEVTIPSSVEEQQRIAEILTSLDNKIELNLQMNQTLEAMAQALFKEWFTNFNFPNFDGVLENGLPVGWRIGRIDDLFILQRGFDLPAITRTEGLYPVVAASGISTYHHEYKVKGPGVTTGRSGVLGKVYYIMEDFWPLNTSLFIKEYKHATPLFAYHILKEMNLLQLNGGSAVPTLNRNDVHGIECIVPNAVVIEQFDVTAKELFNKIAANKKQIQTLTQTRDTLLPKLMSGKIEINN